MADHNELIIHEQTERERERESQSERSTVTVRQRTVVRAQRSRDLLSSNQTRQTNDLLAVRQTTHVLTTFARHRK